MKNCLKLIALLSLNLLLLGSSISAFAQKEPKDKKNNDEIVRESDDTIVYERKFKPYMKMTQAKEIDSMAIWLDPMKDSSTLELQFVNFAKHNTTVANKLTVLIYFQNKKGKVYLLAIKPPEQSVNDRFKNTAFEKNFWTIKSKDSLSYRCPTNLKLLRKKYARDPKKLAKVETLYYQLLYDGDEEDKLMELPKDTYQVSVIVRFPLDRNAPNLKEVYYGFARSKAIKYKIY